MGFNSGFKGLSKLYRHNALPFLFVRGFTIIFVCGALGVDQQIDPHDVPIFFPIWFVLVTLSQIGSLPIKTKSTWWSGSKCWASVCQATEVCAKGWGLCWNLVLPGSFKCCKNLSTIAFHLGHWAIYVYILGGRDSLVAVVTRPWAGQGNLFVTWEKDNLFSKVSRLALRPTQPPAYWLPRALLVKV